MLKQLIPILKETLKNKPRTGGALCSTAGKFLIGTFHENNFTL
jgi:hypothetical protein